MILSHKYKFIFIKTAKTAGTMKRHNFKGQGASHGNHKHHRAPGSIGACSFPGRVWKGINRVITRA